MKPNPDLLNRTFQAANRKDMKISNQIDADFSQYGKAYVVEHLRYYLELTGCYRTAMFIEQILSSPDTPEKQEP
jgi:hypothetical protein